MNPTISTGESPSPGFPPMVPRIPEIDLIRLIELDGKGEHQGSDESENSVELRESGVDEGVCLYVMSLGYSHDTIGADLPLADSGEHADESDADSYTEEHGA